MNNLQSKVAEKLESAADSVRAAAGESAGNLNDLANQAGKKLDRGAARVRTFAGGNKPGLFRDRIRANPVQSVAVAAALGIVAGLSLRAAR